MPSRHISESYRTKLHRFGWSFSLGMIAEVIVAAVVTHNSGKGPLTFNEWGIALIIPIVLMMWATNIFSDEPVCRHGKPIDANENNNAQRAASSHSSL
ncbi:MAG: hypothetical protein OWS74_00325 [Firmicutes bacterium]|nr:hypothetical protein [Bacillota bacterium]